MDKFELINELNNMVIYDDIEEVSRKDIIKAIELYDDIFTRSNHFMHITSSAWIVNQKLTKILLGYHKIYQSFSWIGGHNDGEIDCLKVAKKEVKEESGLTNIKALSERIFSVDILPVGLHNRKGLIVNHHLHLNITYLIQAKEAEQLVIKEDENEDLRWFDINEYKSSVSEKLMISVYKKLNNKVKEGIWQY